MFVLLSLRDGVGAVGVPVNVGLAIGAFKAILFVTVVEKFASSPRAAANSFKVSSVEGAESTRLLICVPTYDCVAYVGSLGGTQEGVTSAPAAIPSSLE